jgi:hypothetical protein
VGTRVTGGLSGTGQALVVSRSPRLAVVGHLSQLMCIFPGCYALK